MTEPEDSIRAPAAESGSIRPPRPVPETVAAPANLKRNRLTAWAGRLVLAAFVFGVLWVCFAVFKLAAFFYFVRELSEPAAGSH